MLDKKKNKMSFQFYKLRNLYYHTELYSRFALGKIHLRALDDVGHVVDGRIPFLTIPFQDPLFKFVWFVASINVTRTHSSSNLDPAILHQNLADISRQSHDGGHDSYKNI